jgi:hypothetical protein
MYFLGTQKAIISTIPSGYKWVSNILGLKGKYERRHGYVYKLISTPMKKPSRRNPTCTIFYLTKLFY